MTVSVHIYVQCVSSPSPPLFVYDCMHLTASSKPGRKYVKKCVLISKVRLTTQVYGMGLLRESHNAHF